MSSSRRHQTLRLVAVAVLAGTFLWAVAAGSVRGISPAAPNEDMSDLGLYKQIVERVSGGEAYYSAAIDEQSGRGYPTSPAMAVRLPTAATLIAQIGEPWAYGLLLTLLATCVILAIPLFERVSSSRLQWYGSLIALAAGLTLCAAPDAIYFHEAWAAALMLLALLLRNSRCWALSLVLALGAFAFRELSGLFIVAMAALAFAEGKRIRSVVWVIAGGGALGAYIFHVLAVREAAGASPKSSSSWLDLGGWPFVVDLVRESTPLSALPYAVAAAIVALSFLGWAYNSHPVARGFLASSLVFAATFMIAGRPNNLYWGMLFSAMILPGFAFSVIALREVFGRSPGSPSARTTQRAM